MDGVQDGLSPDAPSRRFASHGCTMARPAPECTPPWRRDQTVSVQQVRVLPPRTGNVASTWGSDALDITEGRHVHAGAECLLGVTRLGG